MSLEFDTIQVQELIKASKMYRINIPNKEKEIDYLEAGKTLSFTVDGNSLNRTVPVGKRASLKIVYIEEDI